MTTDTKPIDLDKLKAGPETDALVAEALSMNVNYRDKFGAQVSAGSVRVAFWSVGPCSSDIVPTSLPPYSTDMTAAWGALDSLPMVTRCVVDCSSLMEPWYTATLYHGSGGKVMARADAGPIAICLAILKHKAAG